MSAFRLSSILGISLNVRVCYYVSILLFACLSCASFFPSKPSYLQYRCSGNAVSEQVIELRSYLQNSRRRTFFDHLLCDDLYQGLPIGWRYRRLLRDLVAARHRISIAAARKDQGILTSAHAPPRTSTMLFSSFSRTPLLLFAPTQIHPSSPPSLQHPSERPRSLPRSAPRL